MAFKGITFAGQNVTPKNDGGLYNAHYGDGILWGCSMNISGDDLVIQSGEFIMGGRVVQVDGATNVDLSGRSLTTGYIQVIMNADLSQGEGNQWYTTFVESATTTFPALTQDDINDTGTLYQLQLAVVQISGGNLTNITSSVESSRLNTNIINVNSGDTYPYIFLKDNGTTIGELYHNTSLGIMSLHNTSGGRINLYDDGQIFINGNGSMYLRPNGNSTGQIWFDTDGQQHGGHPLYQTTDSTSLSKSISAGFSTWTNITKIENLASGGMYIIWGKITFTPSASTASNINLTISSTNNSSNQSFNSSIWTANTNAKQIEVVAIAGGQTTWYLNCQSGVAGTASTWYFRAIRVN